MNSWVSFVTSIRKWIDSAFIRWKFERKFCMATYTCRLIPKMLLKEDKEMWKIQWWIQFSFNFWEKRRLAHFNSAKMYLNTKTLPIQVIPKYLLLVTPSFGWKKEEPFPFDLKHWQVKFTTSIAKSTWAWRMTTTQFI